MDTDSYLLVLNATEGFLQLAIGETPEHLRCSAHAVPKSAPENMADNVPVNMSESAQENLSTSVLGDISGHVSGNGPGHASGHVPGNESGNGPENVPSSVPLIAPQQDTFSGGSNQKKQDGSGYQVNSTVFSAKTSKKKRGTASLVTCAQEWRLPSQGTELLAPALKDLTRRLGIDITQISHIACVTGPGSFTGIRLTTTSAGGLSMATGALMGRIAFLPLLARNVRNLLRDVLPASTTVWVITHARRDLVHAQAFLLESEEQGGVSAQSEILVVNLDELVALLLVGQGASEQEVKQHNIGQQITGQQGDSRQTVHQPNPVILLGSGITRNKQYLQERLGELSCSPVMLPEAFDVPQAAVLFEAASHVEYGPDELMPEYVRGSDAEEALESIATKLGLDAAEAQVAYQTLQNS